MNLSIGKTAPAPSPAPRSLFGQKFLDAGTSSFANLPKATNISGNPRLSRNFFAQEPQKDKKADETKSNKYSDIKIKATEAEKDDRKFYKTILALAKTDIDNARRENPELGVAKKDFDKYIKAARIKSEFSLRFEHGDPKLDKLWKAVAEGEVDESAPTEKKAEALKKLEDLLRTYSAEELNAQDITGDHSLLVALTINAMPQTIDPEPEKAGDKPKTADDKPAIDNTPQMIDMLVKAGLDLSGHDAAGNNFLQMAAKEGKVKLVKYLLDKNAAEGILSKSDRESIEKIEDPVKKEEALTALKAKFVNHLNNASEPVLALAMRNNCFNVVAALVQDKRLDIDQGMPSGAIINALTAYEKKRAYLVMATKLYETRDKNGTEEGNLIKAWIEENKLKDKLGITCEGMFPKDSAGLMAAWYYSDLNPYKPKESNDKSKNPNTDMYRDQTREGAKKYQEFKEEYKYDEFQKNYKANSAEDDQIFVAEDPAEPNRWPLLKALMSARTRFNANATDNLGRNGVHYAVLLGQFGPGLPVSGPELVALLSPPALAENMPDVDARDHEGRTPLMYVPTRQGSQGIEDAAQILIEHGADPQARTESGNLGKTVLDIFIEERLKYIEEKNKDEKPEFRLKGKESIFDGGGFTLLDALHKRYVNFNNISGSYSLVDLAIEYGDSALFKRLDEIRRDNGGTDKLQTTDNPQITRRQIADMKRTEKTQRAKRLTGPPLKKLGEVTVRFDPCAP
jgi:ankyrin repeat protein